MSYSEFHAKLVQFIASDVMRWLEILLYFNFEIDCIKNELLLIFFFLLQFLLVLGMRADDDSDRCWVGGDTEPICQWMFYLANQKALVQLRFGDYRLGRVAQVEQCPCLWPHFTRYTLDFRTAWGCCDNSGTSMLVNSCSNVSCKDSLELDKSEEFRAVNLQEAA